jgi:hypothetical protein
VSARAVIWQAWSAYRACGLYLVGLTGVFFLAIGAVSVAVIVPFGDEGYALAALLALLGFVWAQAMIVEAIAAIEEPTADRSFRSRVRAVSPYAGTLFVVWILLTAGLAVGFLLLIVPGFVLYARWALVVPILVLERKGVDASFARSKRLVAGRAWTAFWTLVLSGLLALVPVVPIYAIAQALPLSADGADLVTQLAAQAVYLPFLMLCLTVLYADLHSRFAAPAPQQSLA